MGEFFSLNNPSLYFWVVAVVASALYGWRGYLIVRGATGTTTQEVLHQIWFNFVGSVFGWVALFYVVHFMMETHSWNLESKHFGALLVAFVGITGHLPYTFIGTIEYLKGLAAKVLKLN